MKKELKDLTIATIGFILFNGGCAFAVLLLDQSDGKVYSFIEDGFLYVLGVCFFSLCFYVYNVLKILRDSFSKKINLKKHSCRHLETILHTGCTNLGKEEVQNLYNIAFDDMAEEWLQKCVTETNEVNKKILHSDLPQSEKNALKEKYNSLNNKSDIVFYLRSYKSKNYPVEEIYNKIITQY